jgi:hypothetical protein
MSDILTPKEVAEMDENKPLDPIDEATVRHALCDSHEALRAAAIREVVSRLRENARLRDALRDIAETPLPGIAYSGTRQIARAALEAEE